MRRKFFAKTKDENLTASEMGNSPGVSADRKPANCSSVSVQVVNQFKSRSLLVSASANGFDPRSD